MFLETKRDGETQAKPAVFSVEGFIAWLEKQPSDLTYNWLNVCGCACHHYLTAMGSRYLGKTLGSVFPSLKAYHYICSAQPWTLGAALARAREWVAHAEGAADS